MRRIHFLPLTLASVLTVSQPLSASVSDVADAVMRGDPIALRTLLQRKADVNAPQVDGATALHWAVYREDSNAVDLLLRAGAKVDAANREGITPVAMACLNGNLSIIRKLVSAGANAKQLGPNGETLLMLAARNGRPEPIRFLAAAGVDVNAREPLRGTTALMWAVEQRHPEAVKALLDAGADPSARSGPAGLPKNYLAGRVDIGAVKTAQDRRVRAAAAGRTYAEQLRLDGIDGKVNREVSFTPTTPAASPEESDDTEAIVAGLVGAGGGGLTPLVFAAREGDAQSAELLLQAGADVDQKTTYGWTALLTATNNRHYVLASMLIDWGADVTLANKGGWTPLYLATDNRNIENGDYPVHMPDMDHLAYIRILLDNGANPNARAKDNTLTRTIFTMQWFYEDGCTPFVRASQSSDTDLMKLLLAYGADPKISTNYGDTALTAAAGIGWVEGITYERSDQENYEAVKMLLDLGFDPNAANRDGRTPLMGAALKGRSKVVQLLVDHGAKLDQRDRGSRDTDTTTSINAGHTWEAVDYADGLVRTGVQSAVVRTETAALIRRLMTDRGLPVPPPNRTIDSVCVVELCR